MLYPWQLHDLAIMCLQCVITTVVEQMEATIAVVGLATP